MGWATSRTAARRGLLTRSLIMVGLGLAPDLDLLIGRHSMETHSVGAAVLAGAVAAAFRWPLAATRPRIFIIAVLVWFTHPVLDALGADTSAPFGVMMFWPFQRDHVMLETVFSPISRRWWLPGFVTNNLLAIARELVILGPVALVSWLMTQRMRPGARLPRQDSGDVQR
jgi:inner membrane protein